MPATYTLTSTPNEGAQRVTCAANVPKERAEDWLASWQGWFAASRGSDPSGAQRETLRTIEDPLGRLVAKRDTKRGAKALFETLGLRRPRPRRAFELGLEMAAAGVPTAEPLAWITRRSPALLADGVLVRRWVEGRAPWQLLLEAPRTHREAAKEKLFAAIARSVCAMHGAGFSNRDLKEPNLVVSGHPESGELVCWLIDLDGVARERPTCSPSRCQRDLARLYVSFLSPEAERAGLRDEDWQAFLVLYLEGTLGHSAGREEIEAWWEPTRLMAEAKLNRNRERGRPIA